MTKKEAERALRKELASIPEEPGAYYMRGKTVDKVMLADYQVITDKKRQALKLLSPIPLVPGKAVVVIKGARAKFTVGEERPEFYFRREKEERFTIVKVTPTKKDTRIVESLSIAPVVNVPTEQRKEMAVFTQDMGGGVFKVWPEKLLTPANTLLSNSAAAKTLQRSTSWSGTSHTCPQRTRISTCANKPVCHMY